MKGSTVDTYIFIAERTRVNEEFGALSSWMIKNRETVFLGDSRVDAL